METLPQDTGVEAHLVRLIHEQIDEPMLRVNELAQSEHVKKFLSSALPFGFALTTEENLAMDNLSSVGLDTPEKMMGTAHALSEVTFFMREVLGGIYDSEPTETGSVEYTRRTLENLRHPENLPKLIAESTDDATTENAIRTVLPFALMSIARSALEGRYQEGQNDPRFNEELQLALSDVQKGRIKEPAAMNDMVREIYIRSLSLLQSNYHKGQNAGFVRALTASQFEALSVPRSKSVLMELIKRSVNVLSQTTNDTATDTLARFDNTVGVNYTKALQFMGKFKESLDVSADDQSAAVTGYFSSAQFTKATSKTRKPAKKAAPQRTQDPVARRMRLLSDTQAALISRGLVDLMASGYDMAEYTEFEELLTSIPLEERAADATVTEIKPLDWEVLPPGTSEKLKRQAMERGEGADWEIDETRLERLEDYIKMWGDGYIARSKIPNLPEEKQYYLAILPQVMADGTVLEHAIADNPITRHNAAFVWRAERGIGRFGQVQITWKEVFCNDRGLAKRLGARKIKHTSGFEDNLMEYVTRPAERLDDKRYFTSLGKRAMANLINS